MYPNGEVPYPIKDFVQLFFLPNIKSNQQDLQLQEKLILTRDDLEEAAPKSNKRLWTEAEDKKLLEFIEKNQVDWNKVEEVFPNRNEQRCLSRYEKLKGKAKNIWKEEEDLLLV